MVHEFGDWCRVIVPQGFEYVDRVFTQSCTSHIIQLPGEPLSETSSLASMEMAVGRLHLIGR